MTGASHPERPARSEWLRSAIADDVLRSGQRRLLREIADGSVCEQAYARYLVIEEAFVRTAARVAAFCFWAEGDWQRALRHQATLTHLTGAQLDYFAAVRRRWPLPDVSRDAALRCGGVLSDHVLAEVDLHGYPGAVVAMFTAETLYSSWCATAMARDVHRHPDVQEWIALHTEADFLAGVEFLARLVDDIGQDVSDRELLEWGRRMLAAEDLFHDAALPQAAA